MKRLIDIAVSLEQEFINSEYNLEGFPELAEKALGLINTDDVSIEKIIDFLEEGNLDRQFILDDRFGEPSITLYCGREINLDILLWTSSDTAIHSHGFTGAFKVMEGETVQAVYRIPKFYKPPYPEFLNGPITLDRLVSLKKGEVQQIKSGLKFIHKSLHTKSPTINLIFRTNGFIESKKGIIQHTVYLPNTMIKSFQMSPLLSKRVSTINALLKLNDPIAETQLEKFTNRISISELVGLFLNGFGNINFTNESRKIIFESLKLEISKRGLVDILKNDNLLALNNFQMKSSCLLSCTVEALLDCGISLEEMVSFLEDNNFDSNVDVIKHTIFEVINRYNETNSLSIKLNEVALEIFKLLLQGKTKLDITNHLVREYDAPVDQIENDVNVTCDNLMKHGQLSFIFKS